MSGNILEFSSGVEKRAVITSVGNDKNPLLVVDNFLANPEALRVLASNLEFTAGNAAFPGVTASLPLKQDPVLKWVTDTMLRYWRPDLPKSAEFELLRAPDLSRFSIFAPDEAEPFTDDEDDLKHNLTRPHTDPAFLAILIYLTPDSLVSGGTSLWQHRKTAINSWYTWSDPALVAHMEHLTGIPFLERYKDIAKYAPEGGDAFQHYFGHAPLDTTPYSTEESEHWRCLEVVQAKYNRLVAYPGWQFHSAVVDSTQFKATWDEGRLTLQFFVPFLSVAPALSLLS